MKDKTDNLKRDLKAHKTQRRNLLAEWEDIKAAEYRQIETAAKRVSRKLRDRVRVRVTMAGNRDPLEQLLRDEVGGNLAAALDRLRGQDQLSLALKTTEQSRATRQDLEEWVISVCRDKIRPAIVPFFEVVRGVKDNNDVAIVCVTRGYDVHALWHNTTNRYLMRVGTQSREASPILRIALLKVSIRYQHIASASYSMPDDNAKILLPNETLCLR